VSELRIQCVHAREIIHLRHRVLRPGRSRATAHFEGDDDPTTLHFAVFDDEGGGSPICCVSLMRADLDGNPAWQLRGMATDPRHQGRGGGKKLLRFVEGALAELPEAPRILWCNARMAASGFYASQGWEFISPEFDVPDVGPHRKMRKRLPERSEPE
jgi:GNAT superfamily N-acetyltransferase